MNNLDIFLISEEDIKAKTSLPENIDDSVLRLHILEAQDIDLQSVLGEVFYEYLISGLTSYYNNSGSSLTDYLTVYDIKLLDDYISIFLIYTTLYHSRYDLYLSLTRRGVGINKNDNGSNTSDYDKEYYQAYGKEWKNMSAHYLNSMSNFITKNIEQFPLFDSVCDINDETTTTKKNLSSGIGLYLGKSL